MGGGNRDTGNTAAQGRIEGSQGCEQRQEQAAGRGLAGMGGEAVDDRPTTAQARAGVRAIPCQLADVVRFSTSIARE